MNTRALFYVRYLQLKTSNVYKEQLYALFMLENELFKYYPKTEEKILSKIKLKWLFEEIKNKNRNNLILKNFEDSDIVYEKIKHLIEVFDKIIDGDINSSVIPKYKEFNKVYNKFINEYDSNFYTSYIFQIIYMIYENELVIGNSTHNVLLKHFNENLDNMKRTERVFVSLFFEKYPKKISKKRYLYNILKSYF